MIKILPIPLHFAGGGSLQSSYLAPEKLAAKWSLSGNWVAISPNETIPEKYLNKIEERQDFRIYYDLPNDWILINLGGDRNDYFNLVKIAENDFYSIPGHKIIKELDFYGDQNYIWGVASNDLSYPNCYHKLILDEFPWIEKGNWKLVCIGTIDDINTTRNKFKECLSPDIIYEELVV